MELKALAENLIKNSTNSVLQTKLEYPEKLEQTAERFYPQELSLLSFCEDQLSGVDPKILNKVTFYECINFFSLLIHGEFEYINGLVKKSYTEPGNSPTKRYIQQLIKEEVDHMGYFSKFCHKYAGKVYQRKVVLSGKETDSPRSEFLFFAKALIMEFLVSFIDQKAASANDINVLVKDIHQYHFVEESRHIAFGKEYCKELYRLLPSEEVSGIESYLEEYFDVMVASLFNPVILNDAGVDNAYEISRLALRNFKRSEPFHDLEGKFKKLLIHIDLV